MQESPFFIIGAPRSGTTYLAELLNRHPEIFITNETRIMVFVNRVVNVLPAQRRALLQYREEWIEHLRAALPEIIVSFYRKLGAPEGARWGDKFPNYADSRVDPACLGLIDDMFPESRFIHLVRDGRDVIASLLSKGWSGSDEQAIDIWLRHVEHARAFGEVVGDKRYLELKYEDLISSAEPAVEEIVRFLDLRPHPDLIRFIDGQSHARTPFSEPTLPVEEIGRSSWRHRLTSEQVAKIERTCGERLLSFGYPVEARTGIVDEPSSPGAPVENDGAVSTSSPAAPTGEVLLHELSAERRDHARTREALRVERERRASADRRCERLQRRFSQRVMTGLATMLSRPRRPQPKAHESDRLTQSRSEH